MSRNFKQFKSFIRGKRVAVLGIGVSNIPLIDFLYDLDAEITVFDRNTKESLGSIVEKLEQKEIKLELGDNYLDNLKGFDVIFKSPSIRIDTPSLVKAKEEGAYITSEIEEFMKYCKARIFAVTGSDGKTTTTSIVGKLLETEGYKTWVGGNIGTPLFTKIEEIKPSDMVVLELSSFQLMTIDSPVDVAIVTNVTPNHLDMHKGMNEYIEAKKNVFKNQKRNGKLILNIDNDITKSFVPEANGVVKTFSTENIEADGALINNMLSIYGSKICGKDELLIKGIHNVQNFLAAFLATEEVVSKSTMKHVALTFQGVEHRNELVRKYKGIKFYNDSIASTPTRTLASLKSFENKVTLIAGGYDKKVPFDSLATEGHKYIKNIILLGDTKYKIKEEFDRLKESGIDVAVYIVNTLEEAIDKSIEVSAKGDIVTLSPACASFDMFANFMVRGNAYKHYINSL